MFSPCWAQVNLVVRAYDSKLNMSSGRYLQVLTWHACVYNSLLVPQASDQLKDTLFDVQFRALKINEISKMDKLKVAHFTSSHLS